MILGIDCSRMAAAQPTGVELYTDRVIAGLLGRADELGYEEIRCYVKNAPQLEAILDLADNSKKSEIKAVLIEKQTLWTFFWLSLEMLRRPVDRLFVPSHMLPLICPKDSVLTVHGIESLLLPKAYTWKQRFLQRFALWQAKRKKTQLIAVSKVVKQQLIDRIKVPEEKIEVVWNGFDPLVEEGPTPQFLSDSFGAVTKSQLPKGEVPSSQVQGPGGRRMRGKVKSIVRGAYVLSVGRLEERKNQKRLIQAFESLAEEYPKLKLVLVGPDGYGADAVKKQVEETSFKERIIIAGYLNRYYVRSLMEEALVFAYPSLSEGFGIPILEAFSAGVPVLTSKGSATEEVGGNAAEYCDAPSVDSIAQGLRTLLENPTLREQRVRDASKRLDLFSWEKCVEGVVDVLRCSSRIPSSSATQE
jgi:glycosyltransferase involved in cell wall biosynthesis